MELEIFKNTSLKWQNNDAVATRKELELLYNVPRRTLDENIGRLRDDKLVVGRISAILAADGKRYQTEVYNFEEIISIGFRLRSPVAIELQRWARGLAKREFIQLKEQKRLLELELSGLWNKEEIKDLYS